MQMNQLVWLIAGMALHSVVLAGQAVLSGDTHPLTDRLWDVANERYVDKDALAKALTGADYVLLGEKHDNPLHHQHQTWVINQLIGAGRRLGVAFEMIDSGQYERMAGIRFSSADALFDAVSWEQSGWPRRELYRALFDAVIRNESPMYSANLPRQQLRAIMMNEQAPAPEVASLLNDAPLSDGQRAALREDIDESHCNLLPVRHIEGAMAGQRVRDAVMSLSLMERSDSIDVMVLIAGKGHTRNDRGVPSLIKHRVPDADIVSVAWHEVDDDLTTPQRYAEYWRAGQLPFDYVWFTQRLERPDPCEQLKHFKMPEAQNDAA